MSFSAGGDAEGLAATLGELESVYAEEPDGRPHPTLIEQDGTTTLYVCEPVFRSRGGWLAGTSDCESVGEASHGGCELFSPLEIGRCGSQGWAIGAVSSLVVHLHSVATVVISNG